MSTTTMREPTPARYRGLTVTVVGDLRAGLLAVAGYGTPDEVAIAVIAVKRLGSRRLYRVAGTAEWTANVNAVAEAATRAREARDEDRL